MRDKAKKEKLKKIRIYLKASGFKLKEPPNCMLKSLTTAHQET